MLEDALLEDAKLASTFELAYFCCVNKLYSIITAGKGENQKIRCIFL